MENTFFAFDNIKDELLIQDKFNLFKKYVKKDWKVKMFLYCHPDMNIFNDIVYRINWCKKNKVLPYLMRDSSCWDSKNRDFYIDLCAYCNQVNLFKKMTFVDFMQKRTNNSFRRNISVQLFNGGLWLKMDIPHKCKFCNIQLTLDKRKYVNKKTGYYYICVDCCYKCILKKNGKCWLYSSNEA